MTIPLLIVNCTIPFFTRISPVSRQGFSLVLTINGTDDSFRWLIANGRRPQAVEILCKLRGDLSADEPKVIEELEQLDAIVEATKHKRNSILNIALGGRYSGRLNLGRRAVMGFVLQWLQQWTGILAIVTWAGQLFRLAGFSPYKSLWLSGLVNTFGMPGTAAAALVIDRMGRVRSLLVSFITQGISLFLVGALIKESQDNINSNPELSKSLGTAAASFVFVFLWYVQLIPTLILGTHRSCHDYRFFTMFNIIPCWLYGTEIWPQEIRARGYGFTMFGWATGCGMTTFVIPIMLAHLGYKTYLFFGAMNILGMPIIYFFYPETAKRSLEEVDLLFTSDSLLVRKNMQEHEPPLAGSRR